MGWTDSCPFSRRERRRCSCCTNELTCAWSRIRGELTDRFTAAPDRDGLHQLARRVAIYGEPVRGVVESMNGARFAHDELVPAIWLPTVELRPPEREISRWRLHSVKHRSTLKNRVHSTLITFGHQRHMSDRFGVSGRRLLKEIEIPEPWRSHVDASLVLIDDLEARIVQIAKELRRSAPIIATSRS